MTQPNKILIPGKGAVNLQPCNHKGYLTPLLLIPEMVQFTTPGGQPVPVQAFRTFQTVCVNCGHVITFQSQPPPKAEEVQP